MSNDWKPIETAPSDGTRILCVDGNGENMITSIYEDVAIARDGRPTYNSLWIHNDTRCVSFRNVAHVEALKMASIAGVKLQRRFYGPRYHGLLWAK